MTTTDTSAELLQAQLAYPRRRRLWRWLAPVAIVLALISAFATSLALTGLAELTPRAINILLALSATTALFIVAIIVREVWRVLLARRQGRAAARLHVQVVALFSIVAVLPALIVAIVANVTLDRGFDRLFSARTEAVVRHSLDIARAYAEAHAQLINGDILGMAASLSGAKPLFDQSRMRFTEFVTSEAVSRKLPGAIVFDINGTILASAGSGARTIFAGPPRETLEKTTESTPEIVVFRDASYVAAVVRLRGFENTFLYVARLLDPLVVARLRDTEAGVAEYQQLEAKRLGVQVAFGAVFAIIAVAILASAILIGLNFANRLVAPIRRLMSAAQLVSTGDLQVQVPVLRAEGDLAHLGETFNKMTRELRTQRDDLMRASDVIDSRRRFIEAVLSAASAGIIGIDGEGHIGVLNRSAEKLIGHTEAEALGHLQSDIVPELDELMTAARQGSQRVVQGQIAISREGRERILSVRVSAEQTGHSDGGSIITLDDITDLVTAQRTSAWADVARRIAHEIKNPLTPIQLSAERIRRKYGKVIVEDRAVFDQCTDTIIRQVDDIRRMVDEFSRFARMPKPIIENEDVADTVRQVVFLMRVGHPDIDIEVEIAEDPMPARFDRRLISQALTNIIKNATEAIGAVPPEALDKGRIDVKASRQHGEIIIDIIDNGIGLPKESRSRLLEPYVTTREKGTGLGLAIVGRVLEDHGGGIELNDASSIIPGARGAWMRLRFDASGQPHLAESTIQPVMATNGI